MIERTAEMVEAYAKASDPWADPDEQAEKRIDAVLTIVERDYLVAKRLRTGLTPEEIAALPGPRRRLRACVERWPGAEIEGDYDPRCCRFPKSCSATVYDDETVRDEDLEDAP